MNKALAARAIQDGAAHRQWVPAALPTVLLAPMRCWRTTRRSSARLPGVWRNPRPGQARAHSRRAGDGRLESGYLAKAAAAAETAQVQARRLGFDQRFWLSDYLRALAGLALERARPRHGRAAHRAGRWGSPSTGGPPLSSWRCWTRPGSGPPAARSRTSLATIEAARLVLAGSGQGAAHAAVELEALLRLSLGDLHSAGELASGLPAARRGLLLARIALDSGDHHAAQDTCRRRRWPT